MASKEWDILSESEKYLLIEEQDDVPVKLSRIARKLGIKILSSTLPVGVSGEIRPDPSGMFIIKVNRHDSARRQRFTIAHELSHYLIHRNQIGSGITDDALYRSNLSDAREAEANRLAADILMPWDVLQRELAAAQRLQIEDIVAYLAEKFEVSEAAMKIRLGLA